MDHSMFDSPSKNASGRGRPPSREEDLANVRKEIRFTEQEWEELTSVLTPGQKSATFIHDIVLQFVAGTLVPRDNFGGIDPRQFAQEAFPYLSEVPCGNWDEAVDLAGQVVINQRFIDELELRPGDVFVRARGNSMAPAIPNNALVAIRPYGTMEPLPGDRALVQYVDEHGTYRGAIKHFFPGTPPRIQDAEGNIVAYQDGSVPQAVGVVRGVIHKLL